MLDGKAYRFHFPEEEQNVTPAPPNYGALLEALAALEDEFRDILSKSPPAVDEPGMGSVPDSAT